MIDGLLRVGPQNYSEVQGIILVRLVHHEAIILKQVSIITSAIIVVDLLASLNGFA